MDMSSIFGQPLVRDPQAAIHLPSLRAPQAPGPDHKTQFVVELVGPRSVPAASASALLTPEWFSALGEPSIYTMAPADRVWQQMSGVKDGSYDSIALTWDMVADRGELNTQAASHLLSVAESFGTHIQRRAMPMPPPADISRYVSILKELKENLDIGVEIMLVPNGPEFSERDIWIHAAALGFDVAPSGFFEIHAPGYPEPLLGITPSGGQQEFSLTAVERGIRHPGLMIGFSVPLSADPVFSLMSALKTVDYLCPRLGAVAFNDADQVLGPVTRSELQSNLLAAVRALTGAGIEPGSLTAVNLFGSE